MPLNKSELTRAVKSKARSLGFQLVGITNPEQPPHYEVFQCWVQAGYQGHMSYLGTERALENRKDPRLILPECLSIIMLGILHDSPQKTSDRQYPQFNSPDTQGSLQRISKAVKHMHTGQIAAYARGRDYHEVLPERMRMLVNFIEAQVGEKVPNRWYTDSGPVLERDLAQRAGLGWIGKNTCLIHPRLGSFFLLGTVLLGLELDFDPPFKQDHCGSCTRCIEACPTDCILPERIIDSRRCISYLTIELKGPIPVKLRPLIGDWLFGCDICQQVCPWNLRFAPQQGDPALASRPGMPRRDPLEDLKLTPQTFNRQFLGSPVKRSKRRGFLRNSAVAVGNSGRKESLSTLKHTLIDDPEALVRGHTAWAIAQIGGESARKILLEARGKEVDEEVLREIDEGLAALDEESHQQ